MHHLQFSVDDPKEVLLTGVCGHLQAVPESSHLLLHLAADGQVEVRETILRVILQRGNGRELLAGGHEKRAWAHCCRQVPDGHRLTGEPKISVLITSPHSMARSTGTQRREGKTEAAHANHRSPL